VNTEKAFDILKKIQNAGNIHIPEKAKLKSELITELEEIIPLDKQKEIKELQNTSILFLGNAKEAILAGCYRHCLRDITSRIESLALFLGRNRRSGELTKCEIDSLYDDSNAKLIYKDCYGQYIETIWLKDDNNCFSNDLYFLRSTGIREWLKFLGLGFTVFLIRLEGKDSCECKQFVKELEGGFSNLLIHANDKNDLPKYFTSLFDGKIINLEPENQDTPVSTPKDTPERQKTSISEAEQGVTTLFYDDAKGFLFLEDGEKYELTSDEQTLFDYLRKGERHVEDIINHFCNKKEYSNTNWSRGNFDNLTSDLNKKSYSAFGVRLIKNLEKGSGKYGIFVKVRDKKFKK
jgi:hypothetical protein